MYFSSGWQASPPGHSVVPTDCLLEKARDAVGPSTAAGSS